MFSALGDLRVTMLPGGRVRVESSGALAHTDPSPPEEPYPSLAALIAARLRRVP